MNGLWSAEALAEAVGGRFTTPFAAGGIAIDTRRLAPGDLFVALRGENGDGHAHCAAAMAAGAAGCLVHRSVDPGIPALMVEDTTAALARLGAARRAAYAGPVFAVTGSVGKTTTKEMLRVALGAHAAEASHNNHWGVPLTLARLPLGAPAAVVEIGMNHVGEIAPLARLARPHVAIVTNVGSAHIGHLGSLAAIAAEKASVGDGVEPGGTVVLPADSAELPAMRMRVARRRVCTFGVSPTADVVLEEGPFDGGPFALRMGDERHVVRLGAPGRHMALNAAAALAGVQAAGLNLAPAIAALADFTAGAGRGLATTLRLPGGEAWLLDESYNASAASMRAGLALLGLRSGARRIAVLGDMLELGEHAGGEHRGLALDVMAHAHLLFACGPSMRLLYDALPAGRRGAWAADAAALAPIVAGFVQPGDAILVKGSNGSRMRLVVQALAGLPALAEGRAA